MESENLAWKIRRDVLEMVHAAHASHVGSAFSVADIVAVLYNDFANLEQLKSGDKERTRIILSKGHAGAAIYAALAEVGLMDKSELQTYGTNGSKLSCHVSHKGVKGVEISTGSLGQGVGMAAGIALAGKKAGLNYRTFVIAGDGECNEGSVWEMILFARQHKLNNLTLIIDRNGLQGGGSTSEILDTSDLAEKIRAFGWNVQSVDGHNHAELKKSLLQTDDDKPTCIIAKTVKGKGVSFMENNNLWHYRDPQGEDYTNAVMELERQRP